MRARTPFILVAVLVVTAACSSESTSADTTTTAAQEATTVVHETTTTTIEQATTTAAVQESEVPDPTETVLVYGAEVRSTVDQSESTDSDGVTVTALEYVDTIEMSDPRASGTVEWTALLYSPPGDDLGGTWTSDNATLTNSGGTWVGNRVGTYILSFKMPSSITTGPGVKTGEVHYIGQGGYEGLQMDLYTSSDGIIGSIRPLEQDTTEAETSPLEDVAATADTLMVQGSWTDTTSTETGSGSFDDVEVVTIEYSDVLELSDPRASGTMEYTSTLSVLESDVGGTWVIETVTLTNEGGQWVGEAMGAYTYTEHMPDALTSGNIVTIGEWHLVGTGEYEGLRLDLYNSSDGVVGNIRPVN